MEAEAATQLRWILLLIGIAIIVGIYFFTRKNETKRPPVSERKYPGDLRSSTSADDQSASVDADTADVGDSNNDGGELPSPVTEPPEESAADKDRKIIVLHVRAKSGESFPGKDVLSVARQENLIRGGGTEQGFFECAIPADNEKNTKPEVLFYVANMFQPGTFEWQQMDSFETNGLSLFASLPASLPPLDVFRKMLSCAERFADVLGGAVLDEQRQPLTDDARRRLEESLKTYYLRQSQSSDATT